MRRTLISALCLALAVSVCPAGSQLEVTAVRFWTLPEATRVAIETNGEFRFRSDRLENPERLFFDLLGAKPRMIAKGIQTTAVNDKLLKRIRVAETQPGMTRVVLDLESSVDYNASQLTNPDRLIIELRPSGPKTISSAKPAPERPQASSKQTEPLIDVPVSTWSVERSEVEPDPTQLASAPPVMAKVPPPPAMPPAPKPELPSTSSLEPPSAAPPAASKTASSVSTSNKSNSSASSLALAAKHMSTGDGSLIRELGLKINRVVIDAGHGGGDRGSTGPGGLMEKELVLDVALRLGKLIEDRLGSEVIYTRHDDTFIPLENRTQIANDNKADLFLSIHANSSPYPSVSGVETYYLNFASTRDAMDLASRENAGSGQTIHDLTDIIQKITKHDKSEESREFAGKMQSVLFTAAKSNPTAKNRGVKKAPFIVLIGARMPSILAEIGFVSNSREEGLLKRPDHRQKLAEALYRGVARYADSLSHYQVAARD